MSETGIKSTRSYIDPLFNPENGVNYTRVISLSPDSIAFAVIDLKSNTCLGLEEFFSESPLEGEAQAQEFSRVVPSSVLAKGPFHQNTVSITNTHSTLVPDPLFDAERKADYLKFVQGEKLGQNLRSDQLINLKAHNVYAMPVALEERIRKEYPDAGIRHFSSALVDGLSLHHKQTEGDVVSLNIQHSHFEVLHFQDGQLKLYNSYAYSTSEDFIYYTLFSMEQSGLNTDHCPVELYGRVDSESSLYQLLYKYVRHISFGQRPQLLKYSHALDTLPKGYYYQLFQQFLCA